MRALLLFAALAVSASAQTVPDEFPTPGESPGDRTLRDLEERFLPVLSRLYAESSVAASPALQTERPVLTTTLEGGYRFWSGDALAVFLGAQTEAPLPETGTGFVEPPGTTAGLRALLALDRFGLGNAELALGASQSWGQLSGRSLDVTPQYVFGDGNRWTLPVGLRVRRTETLGAARWFVGPTVGVRVHYRSPSRMVLDADADPAD